MRCLAVRLDGSDLYRLHLVALGFSINLCCPAAPRPGFNMQGNYRHRPLTNKVVTGLWPEGIMKDLSWPT